MSISDQEKQRIFDITTEQGKQITALEVRVEAIKRLDKRTCNIEKSMRHLWWRMGVVTGLFLVGMKIAISNNFL